MYQALRNKVQLIGNLGNAPEIKSFEGGKKLAKFSIATNDNYVDSKGEKAKETMWHNAIAWGKIADVAERYLQKGSEVIVEGKLINRSYTDKNGEKKFTSEIQVNELLMVGGKKEKE